jgi:prepilin-type processing-associated H-X9-DG protein
MANMYAADFKDTLPGVSFFPTGAGNNPWDVGIGFIPAVANYGLTAPMWFCPVRTEETAAQYAAAKTFLMHDLSSIDDLNRYLANYFGGGFVIMNYNLWVNRKSSSAYIYGSLPDPNVPPTVANTDPAIYGWPIKTTDRASARVPYISDACFSGYGTSGGPSVENINVTGANNAATLIAAKKSSGHAYNRSRSALTVNMVFADGHVEARKKQKLQCVYIGDSNSGWFY